VTEDGNEIIDLVIGDELNEDLEKTEINDIVKIELNNILNVLDEREILRRDFFKLYTVLPFILLIKCSVEQGFL
jgi:hypothetical protein